MAGQKSAQQLIWVDLETTGLPTEHDECIDFSDVHVLEFAMIITDRSLNIQANGYTEVIKLTQPAADALRASEYVKKMHTENGLIKDSIFATLSLADVDMEVDRLLRTETTFDKGEFAIAGSGVAMFDFPLIRAKMPRLASWLAYYPYDFGIERRISKDLAGRDLINPTHSASYGDTKVHRAMADVEAHLREAQAYRDWFRSLPNGN